MLVLVSECSAETVVKGSRFLAEALCVSSQAEARARLSMQKAKYPDATHVVHAFVTGPSGEVSGMSDDGEPSGTAGRPVLDVLRGSGITNILLTVTRWFGGTLLGTGGLVHAYSDVARKVLSLCVTEELVQKIYFSYSTDYSSYQTIKRETEKFHFSGVTEKFDSDIEVSGNIWLSESEEFFLMVKNITRGKSLVTLQGDIL